MSNSKLIGIKIDLTKIDKTRIFAGKNGAKWYDIDVWINDEPDQYGNDASASTSQTKEERENKDRKTYLGNGKKLYGWQEDSGNNNRPATRQTAAGGPVSDSSDFAEDPDDDIPF